MVNIKLMKGDCLELMKEIPDGSVDLVLTDPPYGTVQGLETDGWKGRAPTWDLVIPFDGMWSELERIVRPNGAVVLFGQEPFTSNLIKSAIPSIPFSYRCIWDKDHFANPLMARKAPLNYYEDINFFFKIHDSFFVHPLRDYSKKVFDFIGLNKKSIFKVMRNQRACHFLRFNSNQFSLCTKATYVELIKLFKIDEMDGFKSYEELYSLNEKYTRTFNLNEKTHISNIFKYKRPKERFHPTQKPTELLEELICIYSNEGDTVLDFTAGSMSTAVACINTNRNCIMIEKDEHYYNVGKDRVVSALQDRGLTLDNASFD